MVNIYKEADAKIAEAFRRGKENIVTFNRLFLPIEDEVEPAWFHYLWSDILLNGDKHFAVEGFRESAKALDVTTIVPTPNGYTTIGNIKVGDFVLDEFGKPVEVEYISPVFIEHPCFKLTMDTGEEIIADAEHLWSVQDKHKRRGNTLSTLEMFAKQDLGKPRGKYQEKAYRIPCTYAEYDEKELPIDPYLLGYWLGDGTSGQPNITVGDSDLESFKKNIAWQHYTVHRYKPGSVIVALHGFKKLLVDNGLLNNKYVPLPYMFGSTRQRFELLAGLIDSDGTIAKSGTKIGTISFVNKNKRLAEAVRVLACSLGMKTTMIETMSKLYGKECGIVYKVSFKPSFKFLKLERKNKYIQEKQDRRSLLRTISKIEPTESVPCVCIKVKSESGCFQITSSHIITHNSTFVLRAFPLYRLTYPTKKANYIVFIMANQTKASKQLKEIADTYVSNEFLSLNLVKVKQQSDKAFECVVTDENGEEIRVRMEAYGKGSSIRGLLWGDKRPDIIIIDDPQDVEDSLSDTIQTNDYDWFLSDAYFLGKRTRIFMIGNNLGEKCLIEQVINNKDLLKFNALRIPVMNENGESNWAERFPVEEILEEKEAWRALGKLDIWEREKMCIAISPERQTFKKEYFMYYAPTELKLEDCSIYTTVDLAISQKESADYTVVCTVAVNSDNKWFILDIDFDRYDPSQTIDAIFRAVQKYKPLYVGVEKVAYQASVKHYLEKEMPKRNIWFTVKDLEASSRKELRIATLQPRFKSGSVWFPMGAKFLTELESELQSFPKGLHDDLIDALAYISQIALPPVGNFSSVSTADIPLGGAM
nr:MAG TPA: Terminase large subunit [Caudoviricetes sp.]